jgi:hypothetical protein
MESEEPEIKSKQASKRDRTLPDSILEQTLFTLGFTQPIAKITCVKNMRAKVFCGIIFLIKKTYAENVKKDRRSRLGVAC